MSAGPQRPRRLPEAIQLIGMRNIRIIHDGEMWKLVDAQITDDRRSEVVVLSLRAGTQSREVRLDPHERVILVD